MTQESTSLRVTVLLGGTSAEREISLSTGRAVVDALRKSGHEVHELDPLDPLTAVRELERHPCDVVFVALHGGFGEDGRIQALLELAHQVYVGSGPTACAVAMDKLLSKHVCRSVGIPTPEWDVLEGDEDTDELVRRAAALADRVVLKPVAEGSAVGVVVCPDEAELRRRWESEQRTPGRWLLERYIAGREMTLPILWGTPTPIIEIRPRSGFYDYKNKYTPGCSEYDCPADLDPAVAAELTRQGMALWKALGLRDMARIDFRLDESGHPWCLEANTIPGMTAVSLLPMGAAKIGLSFEKMCDELCRRALARAADSPGGRP